MNRHIDDLRSQLQHRRLLDVTFPQGTDRRQAPPFCFPLSSWLHLFEGKLHPGISLALAKAELARLGFAIEKYRNNEKTLPDKLDDLIPTYLDTLPIDPSDGHIVRYRKLSKGYVIYLVGEDLEDNGGVQDIYEDDPDIIFRVAR